MAIKYIDDGRPDGICVARSDNKLGFYGTTPIVQPSGAAQDAVSQTMTTGNPTNSTIATDLKASIVLLNKLRTDLVALGMLKGEA